MSRRSQPSLPAGDGQPAGEPPVRANGHSAAPVAAPAQPPPSSHAAHDPLPDLRAVALARELFWDNVVREMLTSLSIMQMQGTAPELFDGRIQVLTRGGERIPIGVVFPLFACSIPGRGRAHEASMAVECTVFRIQTPEGEVFTLPVHEIRALASLTEDLIKQLEQASLSRTRPDSDAPGPFGFAAYVPRRDPWENGQPAI